MYSSFPIKAAHRDVVRRDDAPPGRRKVSPIQHKAMRRSAEELEGGHV